MPPCLTLGIIYKDQGYSGAIQGKELCPPLRFGVVAIEKGAFEPLSFIYIYIYKM